MCDPATAIAATTATVSAASSVFGFIGKGQKASADRTAANLNYAQDYNAAGARGAEIDQAASEDAVSSLIEGAKARGRISAAAGSLGLGAGTEFSLQQASTFDTARQGSVDALNFEHQRQQNVRELAGANQRRASLVAAAKKPSPVELVFGLAKAGLKGASAYQSAGGTF